MLGIWMWINWEIWLKAFTFINWNLEMINSIGAANMVQTKTDPMKIITIPFDREDDVWTGLSFDWNFDVDLLKNKKSGNSG